MSYQFILIEKFGGPEVLTLKESALLPDPDKNKVRIKVLATSAAFTDTLIRRGIYPDVRDQPPITPGYDMIGLVDKVGEYAGSWEEGEMVAALTVTGAYSQYMVLPSDQLVKVPKSIPAAEGVSLILSYVTAYQMLTRSAKVKAGNKVLIHGAGGAVGSALVQVGKTLGLKMYCTASKNQEELLKESGCHFIDYKSNDFAQKLQQLEPEGLDAVFDPFGGANFTKSLKVLQKSGILVAYGSYNASSKFGLIKDFLRTKLWNLLPWMPNTTFYSIGDWHKKHFDWFKEDLDILFNWYLDGQLKPIIAKKMKLSEAPIAHRLIEKGGLMGKIVLIMDDGHES